MPIVVYYDFTSVESFALSELLASADGLESAEWRGVESLRGLPEPAAIMDRRTRTRLEMDLVPLERGFPGFTVRLPDALPNSRRAMQAVAAVARVHPPRADAFRIQLFRELWHHGGDISARKRIREVANEAGVPPFVDLENIEVQTTQRRWQVDWETARLGGVPRAIRGNGEILWRLESEAAVQAFFAARDVPTR